MVSLFRHSPFTGTNDEKVGLSGSLPRASLRSAPGWVLPALQAGFIETRQPGPGLTSVARRRSGTRLKKVSTERCEWVFRRWWGKPVSREGVYEVFGEAPKTVREARLAAPGSGRGPDFQRHS